MDLSLEVLENKIFNVRVAIYIKCIDKILVTKNKYKDYYSLPGGRIKYNEDSKSAIIREIKEELNLDIDNVDFVSVVENFFKYSNNDEFHEYLFLYEVNIDDKYYNYDFINLEDSNIDMIWINIKDFKSIKLKPSVCLDIINNKSNHYIFK